MRDTSHSPPRRTGNPPMPTSPIPGGLLIAIEGIDGAGKTTLAEGLRNLLAPSGARITLGKEPTRGPWGMKLRDSAAHGRLTPENEKRFLLLDRRQHVDDVIRPALARGEVVILDRYYPSMVAYQGAAGLPVAQLLDDNAFAPRPDVLILLDLPPALGLERIRARGDQPNAFETLDTLLAVRAIFLALQESGLCVIDATRTVEQVQAEAWRHVMLAITRKFQPRAGMAVADAAAAAAAIEDVIPYLRGAV